jgi:hypothetical protein
MAHNKARRFQAKHPMGKSETVLDVLAESSEEKVGKQFAPVKPALSPAKNTISLGIDKRHSQVTLELKRSAVCVAITLSVLTFLYIVFK